LIYEEIFSQRCVFVNKEDSTLTLILKRWPIFALILLAWIFLGFVIPLSVNFLLRLPDTNIFMQLIIKHILPIAFFLGFLYIWYKITDKYYKKKAKSLFGG